MNRYEITENHVAALKFAKGMGLFTVNMGPDDFMSGKVCIIIIIMSSNPKYTLIYIFIYYYHYDSDSFFLLAYAILWLRCVILTLIPGLSFGIGSSMATRQSKYIIYIIK